MANLLCLQLLQAFMYDVKWLLHWANTVVIVVAPLVSLHCCVAHTWVCWFQFLCKEPEWDRAVVRSHLSHIFPLHSELAHAHNYPCSRYQALFFVRPSVRCVREKLGLGMRLRKPWQTRGWNFTRKQMPSFHIAKMFVTDSCMAIYWEVCSPYHMN